MYQERVVGIIRDTLHDSSGFSFSVDGGSVSGGSNGRVPSSSRSASPAKKNASQRVRDDTRIRCDSRDDPRSGDVGDRLKGSGVRGYERADKASSGGDWGVSRDERVRHRRDGDRRDRREDGKRGSSRSSSRSQSRDRTRGRSRDRYSSGEPGGSSYRDGGRNRGYGQRVVRRSPDRAERREDGVAGISRHRRENEEDRSERRSAGSSSQSCSVGFTRESSTSVSERTSQETLGGEDVLVSRTELASKASPSADGNSGRGLGSGARCPQPNARPEAGSSDGSSTKKVDLHPKELSGR